MEQFIKDRLSTIVSLVIGTGTGWGFTTIISAPELHTWLVTIAIAVSFLLSLVISLSLSGKITNARRKKNIKNTVIVFASFLFAIGIFFVLNQKYTIKIPWIDLSMSRTDTVIVKGLFYSASAKNYREIVKKNDPHQSYPSDATVLDDATYDIEKVWPADSRTYARLLLLFTYTIMIALFIAGVTLATEIITRTTKKPEG